MQSTKSVSAATSRKVSAPKSPASELKPWKGSRMDAVYNKFKKRDEKTFCYVPLSGQALMAIKWAASILVRDYQVEQWKAEAIALESMLQGFKGAQ